MNKLKLDVDELNVESFDIRVDDMERGTVEALNETATCGESCPNTCVSCVATCQNTCDASCWGTCYTCQTCEFHCTHISVC
jgi:hypothetical protein